MTCQSGHRQIGSFQSLRIVRGRFSYSSFSSLGNLPYRLWKSAMARAYCLPRKSSSCSRSLFMMVATEGATPMMRIARIAIPMTTATSV